MVRTTYLVKLRSLAIQYVVAAKVEIHGEHVAFLNSNHGLAGLFHLDTVESWNAITFDTPVADQDVL
jgi:hypothetical protein